MSSPWLWYALGLALIAGLLYAANAYMNAVLDDITAAARPFDPGQCEDWLWAGIEAEWHQFLDQFPMTAERS